MSFILKRKRVFMCKDQNSGNENEKKKDNVLEAENLFEVMKIILNNDKNFSQELLCKVFWIFFWLSIILVVVIWFMCSYRIYISYAVMICSSILILSFFMIIIRFYDKQAKLRKHHTVKVLSLLTLMSKENVDLAKKYIVYVEHKRK